MSLPLIHLYVVRYVYTRHMTISVRNTSKYL